MQKSGIFLQIRKGQNTTKNFAAEIASLQKLKFKTMQEITPDTCH